MEKSEQINELAGALSKAQGIMELASKDTTNPFFKSKYADLASVMSVIKEPLSKNGLAVSQHATAEGNVVTVETVLMHSTGQWISSKLTMTSKDNTPQGIGSCITYARRYGLSSMLGIASEEDDDGNLATNTRKASSSSTMPQGASNAKEQAKPQETAEEALNRVLSEEEGELLLSKIAFTGWTKKDLQEYVSFELDLDSILKIKQKHMKQIVSHFSQKKETKK